MGRRCCVEGCTSRSGASQHHGVTYHSYPLDAITRSIWIRNTRLPSDRNITKSVLVCSRHFRRADFQTIKNGKYLLKQRVVPTVFPWGKLDVNAVVEEAPNTTPTTTTAGMAAEDTGPSEDGEPESGSIVEATTSEAVEEKVAQIMAAAAELNATPGMKPEDSETSLQLGKRPATASESTSDEQPTAKQARTGVESSPGGSPGVKFEPVTVFTPGVRLEAQDFDGVWHLARVIEVDNDEREVLIKFDKNGKQKSAAMATEEWIPMDSIRLRQRSVIKPIPVFELEEKVMARWSGPRRFPGTVKKVFANNVYEVLFDDGFVKNVRAAHMKKLGPRSDPAASPVHTKSTSTPTSSAGMRPKPKHTSAAVATSSPSSKSKRPVQGQRRDWPLLQMDKLDLASLNLPKIPVDGEWTCHWVNDQPIGKEGYLVVGEHKKPTVIVDDWRLPAGWVKHMYQRSNVLGKWDVILVSPNGKRFRSKSDLKMYLEEQGRFYNPDVYDFSIHRRRAKDINAYVYTPDYAPQHTRNKPSEAAAESVDDQQTKSDASSAGDKPDTSEIAPLVSSLGSETRSQYIEPLVVTPMPPMELMTSPKTPKQMIEPIGDAAEATTGTAAEDGFASIGGLKVQIVDNLFRCPQDGCSKNFRKENHLQIHVKHYHPDLIKLLGACPKMQELAEKRTLGTSDANEPQPKNQISNQQFFAKLHQQDLELSRSHRRLTGAPTTPTTTEELSREKKVTDSELAAKKADYKVAVDAKEKADNGIGKMSLDLPVCRSTTATDFSQTNTTDGRSMMNLSVASSTAEESATGFYSGAVSPPKRLRFSPNKRYHGSRKSTRQRTTRRYFTATQATAGRQPSVVTADSRNNNFGADDFEETRHSFNTTPDVKPSDARKRKPPAATATPLSSLDSPVTADSGSSTFQPMPEESHPLVTPQYIKENGELIKIVRMRQEEIINCLCSYGEEDGLMIQCELCLCWQHGGCNGIEKESDVPDKYICYICRNPQRGRKSMRYKHDQDWLYEGKLPVANYHNPNPEHSHRFDVLKRSHTLTGNLVELKRFMHSLRVKINIANNKDHPKMYLWAKKWDEEDIKTEVKTEEEQAEEAGKITGEAEVLGANNDREPRSDSDAQMREFKAEPASPPRPNIPQPEAAIEPVECQQRLLEHIKIQQERVMKRLLEIESEIDDLEKLDTLPDLKGADLSTTKDVVSSFMKELDVMKQIASVNELENTKYARSLSVIVK